ncbi:hypothetical protein CABS01_04710 [Colletotrichum abscissum]|uniref:uncharacterized protein n=1 Tax=Colletotrichum abscissum TaxID=1671311 RepID=UPI0027D61CCC|nr:uncharacterized protein CABS01_04710 [Colletotrichum abscissum]KAK1472067.1 hypothetical protein CABS01_04710 [Colletotrichum abscissum]
MEGPDTDLWFLGVGTWRRCECDSLTFSLLTAQALARWVRVQGSQAPHPQRLQRLPSDQDSQRVSELAVDPRPVRISPNERQRLPTRSLSKEPLFKRPCLVLPLLLSVLRVCSFALCLLLLSTATWYLRLFALCLSGHHLIPRSLVLPPSLPRYTNWPPQSDP